MVLFNLIELKTSSIASYAKSCQKTWALPMLLRAPTLERFLVLGKDQVLTAMQTLLELLLPTTKMLAEQVGLKKLPLAGITVSSFGMGGLGCSGVVWHVIKASFMDLLMNWFGGKFELDISKVRG
jgi:hypothetical protein